MCFFLIRPWRYLNPQLQNLRVSKWALRRFICIQTNHSAEPSTTDLWYLAASYYPITAIGTTSLLKARTLRLPRFISCGFSSLLQVVVVRRDDVADARLRRHRLLADVFVKTFGRLIRHRKQLWNIKSWMKFHRQRLSKTFQTNFCFVLNFLEICGIARGRVTDF